MDDATYKVHLDGFNQLDLWTGKTRSRPAAAISTMTKPTSWRSASDNWKMHIGVKKDGSWFNEKCYPSVPYLFNLRMDPMEKMDPRAEEWGYIGRKFFGSKLWAPTAGRPLHRRAPERARSIRPGRQRTR